MDSYLQILIYASRKIQAIDMEFPTYYLYCGLWCGRMWRTMVAWQ